MTLQNAVVVIPAHNEAAHLPRCLRATTTAATCLPVPVLTVVVLDACDDDSALVGRAIRYGRALCRVSKPATSAPPARPGSSTPSRSAPTDDPARTWYATTDADTRVDPDWLLRQMASGADMVLGVVRVAAWRHFPAAVARRYLRRYHSDGPGHNHIHGANMGFRADSYWQVGGFQPLATGEDVDLVDRFEAAGLRVLRDEKLSVETSDRRTGRAPGGFAHHLRELSGSVFKRKASEPDMTAGLVGHWLSSGALDLPLPGSGETARRWQRLAELTEVDVVAGRLAEAHTDAVAILAELGGPAPHPGQLWGVWAAESPDAVLSGARRRESGQARRHEGVVFGCGPVHARAGDRAAGQRASRVVRRRSARQRGATAAQQWRNAGMAGADTRSVQFTATPRRLPSATRGSTWTGPASGTARSGSPHAGWAAPAPWRRRCMRRGPRIPRTRTRWRTWVRWTPRSPRPRRR